MNWYSSSAHCQVGTNQLKSESATFVWLTLLMLGFQHFPLEDLFSWYSPAPRTTMEEEELPLCWLGAEWNIAEMSLCTDDGHLDSSSHWSSGVITPLMSSETWFDKYTSPATIAASMLSSNLKTTTVKYYSAYTHILPMRHASCQILHIHKVCHGLPGSPLGPGGPMSPLSPFSPKDMKKNINFRFFLVNSSFSTCLLLLYQHSPVESRNMPKKKQRFSCASCSGTNASQSYET